MTKPGLALLMWAIFPAAAADIRIQAEDLPPAVQSAMKQHIKDATVVSYLKSDSQGATRYEVATKVGGKARDVIFDTKGNLLSIEEETALDRIPEAARRTIQTAAGDRKLRVDTVSEDGETYYQAAFREGGAERVIRVNASGKPVK